MSDLFVPPEYILATAKQSREIDSKTINEFGIDGFTLMEVAGSSTAKHLLEILPPFSHGVFFCGKGNNAGDALVVTRYLIQHRIKATIVFISGTDDLSVDTQKNLNLLHKILKNDPRAGELNLITSWSDFDLHTNADFIIDGMLGTGISSELRGNYPDAVEWANESGLPVYSIDIPTGLHADRGNILGSAIKATTTFVYGIRKQGFYLNDGYQCTGEIVFCELPFPNYSKSDCNTFLIDEKWIKKKERELPKHKYDGGILYVIAGSKGLTGAAIMAAKSAWAVGLGAVILITPEGNLSIYEKNLPQIIKKIVGSEKEKYFQKDHLQEVLNIINEKKGTVLIGPGLGRNEETIQFVQSFLQAYTGKIVIDADALFALSKAGDWVKPEASKWILTPHPGELSLLLNSKKKEDPERLFEVKKMAVSRKLTLVSKGFPVAVGTQQGNLYLTSYNTKQFSRAGFGDVLAGKISAYWALNNDSIKSTLLGLLNGKMKIDNYKQTNPNYIPEPVDFI